MAAIMARIPPVRGRRAGLRASNARCRDHRDAKPAGTSASVRAVDAGLRLDGHRRPVPFRRVRRDRPAVASGLSRRSADQEGIGRGLPPPHPARRELPRPELPAPIAASSRMRPPPVDGRLFLVTELHRRPDRRGSAGGAPPLGPWTAALDLAMRVGEALEGVLTSVCWTSGRSGSVIVPTRWRRVRLHGSAGVSARLGPRPSTRDRGAEPDADSYACWRPKIARAARPPGAASIHRYGIGAMLYELLTGHPPFPERRRVGCITDRELRPLRSRLPQSGTGIPRDVQWTTVSRMLDHDPSRQGDRGGPAQRPGPE